MAVAPVPVTKLTCDGDTYKCTAKLASLFIYFIVDHM
jgi:hypothetical protein